MEVGIVIFPLPALVCADTMNVHPFPPEKIPIFIRCKKLHAGYRQSIWEADLI